MYECLLGLIQAQCRPSQPKTFRDWIGATFGSGMARHFMLPYNEKVWATPLELMSFDWIAERVTVVGLDAVLRNVVLAVVAVDPDLRAVTTADGRRWRYDALLSTMPWTT